MTIQNRKAFIKSLGRQGYTHSSIAKLLNISRQRVYQLVRKTSKYKSIRHRNTTKEMPHINFAALGIKGGVDLVREMVRIRDNRTCQICGKIWVVGQRRFDVHHLDEKLEGSDNKPHLKRGRVKRDRENMDRMVTYCHKCHLNLHTVRKKMSDNHKSKIKWIMGS